MKVRLTEVDGGRTVDTAAKDECYDRDIAACVLLQYVLLLLLQLARIQYSAIITSPGTWYDHAQQT